MPNPYTKLAKTAVEHYIKTHEELDLPADTPEDLLNQKKGAFVTLFNNGELRGCIGTFLPVQENIGQEIIKNAVSACSKDFRFKPITEEELPELSYEVSLLSEPERIHKKSELDPKKYGIIVQTLDGRAGLLLPGLEGVDTVGQQISIAAEKGGIDPNVDELLLFRFVTTKYT